MKKGWIISSVIVILIIVLFLIFLFSSLGEKLSPQMHCIVLRGEWDPTWTMQGGPCLLSYSDGGKKCFSSDECKGDCVTNIISNLGVEGVCEEYNYNSFVLGCDNKIENSRFECRIKNEDMDEIIICDPDYSWDERCNVFKENMLLLE